MTQINSTNATKNTDGHLGPICNNCGGFGYTFNLLGSGSIGCIRCNQTGIQYPSVKQLQNQVENLTKEIQWLKEIIIKEIKKGV